MMLVQMNPAVVLGQMNPDFVPGMSALDCLHRGGYFFFLQSSVSVFRSDVFECVESGLFSSYFFSWPFFSESWLSQNPWKVDQIHEFTSIAPNRYRLKNFSAGMVRRRKKKNGDSRITFKKIEKYISD